MRIEISPQAVLSRNGYLAAVVHGTELTLIQTREGLSQTISLPHEGSLAACDPQAALVAVTGDKQLSLFETGPPPRLMATVPLPAQLYRLAGGEAGVVVGVAAMDADETSQLLAWQGPQLRPLFSEAGQSLGPIAVDGLQIDGSRQRLLYWGLQAREHTFAPDEPPLVAFETALYGDGEPVVRLVGLEKPLQVLWAGQDAPADPNGFLLPLAGGKLGAYNREKFVVFEPESSSGDSWQPVSIYQWEALETVVASPSGTYLAWLWSTWDGEREYNHLRVASLGGELKAQTTFEDLGDFPALAVDDRGQVTLVFSADKNQIMVLVLEEGGLVQQAEVPIRRA